MKRILLLLICCGPLTGALNAQPGSIERKFFPAPDVSFGTPAFTGGDEDYGTILRYLETLVKKAPGRASLTYVGKTQGGLDIPAVTITGSKQAGTKVKVMFTGAIHGDEPCGTEGLLVLMDSLLSSDKYAALLDRIELRILPVVNIDGYLKSRRVSRNKLDINRDFTKLETPEAQCVYRAYAAFSPDVFVDFHEFNPYRADFAKMQEQGVTTYFDALLLYSGNLNIDAGIRGGCMDYLINPIKKTLTDHQLRSFEYFKPDQVHGHTVFNLGSNSPRSTSTSFALNNSLSMLLEIRGVGLEKYSMKRRTLISYLVASTVLHSVAAAPAAVMELVSKAREQAANGTAEAVVKTAKKRQLGKIPFIDINKGEQVDIDAEVSNNLLQTKITARPKPKAYLITANTDRVKDILDAMGITYTLVQHEASVEAEGYQLISEGEGDEQAGGLVEQVAEVATHPVKITVHAGALCIPTNQPKANLLTELAEPDAVNSWYRFRVLSQDAGVIPVYRCFTSYTL